MPSSAERVRGENFYGRMIDQNNSKTEECKRFLEVAPGAMCPPGSCPSSSHQPAAPSPLLSPARWQLSLLLSASSFSQGRCPQKSFNFCKIPAAGFPLLLQAGVVWDGGGCGVLPTGTTAAAPLWDPPDPVPLSRDCPARPKCPIAGLYVLLGLYPTLVLYSSGGLSPQLGPVLYNWVDVPHSGACPLQQGRALYWGLFPAVGQYPTLRTVTL